ncbi:MAG: nucleotide sugar dehydrogenase [Gemmatimonadetes bacterium]|nr:nucleotide sugar dehydrogenase [Gemmatimonadota bacterium]
MIPTPDLSRWRTVVVGPGIVGMPMAALLADATRRLDAEPGEVVVVQRASRTSGWKVDAINRGESPIGGVEPALDALVATNAAAGTLRATHTYDVCGAAHLILVCVQTDRKDLSPDYGPLFEALHGIAAALAAAPDRKAPLLVIESTLAPSTMESVIAPLFATYGLQEGRDIHLGNSPNRVMPGRLVERVAAADKLVGALAPETARRIAAIYARIVTGGRLWETTSTAAEIVKTLENAYRDVRIAFAAEVARWCDANEIDFHALREAANEQVGRTDVASRDGMAVPSGALLVPTLGVGGHCLPKDGILLWWRAIEAGRATSHSLIMASREINDASPGLTAAMATTRLGPLSGKRVAILGAAYRGDSEDTRNAPALVLARLLRGAGAQVTLHDPYVRPTDANIAAAALTEALTTSLDGALRDAEVVFVAVAHAAYRGLARFLDQVAPHARLLVDGANLFTPSEFALCQAHYVGIGKGHKAPSAALVEAVVAQFRAVERGIAHEVSDMVDFLNARGTWADGPLVRYADVQAMARSCATGCDLVDVEPVDGWTAHPFESRLAVLARKRWGYAPRYDAPRVVVAS